jgi:ArsR family transcriptional regulator
MNTSASTADPLWVVKALSALAQVNRLNVFRQLVVAGPSGMFPSDIAIALGVASNSLSFHLKELLNCELISQEREGRNLRYRANLEQMQSLLGFLVDECCQGQPCFTLPSVDCSRAPWQTHAELT